MLISNNYKEARTILKKSPAVKPATDKEWQKTKEMIDIEFIWGVERKTNVKK